MNTLGDEATVKTNLPPLAIGDFAPRGANPFFPLSQGARYTEEQIRGHESCFLW